MHNLKVICLLVLLPTGQVGNKYVVVIGVLYAARFFLFSPFPCSADHESSEIGHRIIYIYIYIGLAYITGYG